MAPKKEDAPVTGYDPDTMGRPEDGEGLSRARVEDGGAADPSEVTLVAPERGAQE